MLDIDRVRLQKSGISRRSGRGGLLPMKTKAAAAAVVLLIGGGAFAQTAPAIDAARIKEHVRILSGDDFAGRGPAQPGEAKTIDYLAKAFAAAGLQPGGANGSWYQDVALVRYDRADPVTIGVTVGGRTMPLAVGGDVTAASRIVGRTEVSNAPMVFVGYGVDAPALGHSDFAGVDLKGKVAVFLANDPDFEAPDGGKFGGRAMTYFGRFGAKVEAAQRQGAIAALIVHETAAASYPWSQVQNSDPAPGFGLAPTGPAAAPFGLRGWLRREVAVDLFRRAGLDYEALKRQARQPGFRAVPIGNAALSASLTTTAEKVVSRNVVARLPGKARPNETIVYGAHWDANGIGAPDAEGDTIRNGAVDNAVGTATLLEVARAFAKGPKPDRSIVFIAYAAEEKGLLGAEHYAANPLYALETTVAAFNHDPHVVLGRARNLDVVGGGKTELEQDLVRVAGAQGLRIDPEPSPEAGWYYRSDHFAFAKRGVPTVYFRAGRDLVRGGTAAGEAAAADYNEKRYHQTSDEFDPRWDMAGAEQEGRVAFELGRELANSTRWPTWNEGIEYKAVRDRSAAARGAAGAGK
jgi:Zn-dependent M28 family amino/carboxypeptidase